MPSTDKPPLPFMNRDSVAWSISASRAIRYRVLSEASIAARNWSLIFFGRFRAMSHSISYLEIVKYRNSLAVLPAATRRNALAHLRTPQKPLRSPLWAAAANVQSIEGRRRLATWGRWRSRFRRGRFRRSRAARLASSKPRASFSASHATMLAAGQVFHQGSARRTGGRAHRVGQSSQSSQPPGRAGIDRRGLGSPASSTSGVSKAGRPASMAAASSGVGQTSRKPSSSGPRVTTAGGSGIVAGLPSPNIAARSNRQDFSHRGAEAKSLLDEVLRRGREERGGRVGRGSGDGAVEANGAGGL